MSNFHTVAVPTIDFTNFLHFFRRLNLAKLSKNCSMLVASVLELWVAFVYIFAQLFVYNFALFFAVQRWKNHFSGVEFDPRFGSNEFKKTLWHSIVSITQCGIHEILLSSQEKKIHEVNTFSTAQCGNYGILLPQFFRKFFVKSTFY